MCVNFFACVQTLPAFAAHSQAHDVGFPLNSQRVGGVRKLLYLYDDCVLSGDNRLGLTRGRHLAGAPNPSSQSRTPNIAPAKLDWSEIDLFVYFETGFTSDYDGIGGEMTGVVSNLAQLPAEDRRALEAYLKAIPPHP